MRASGLRWTFVDAEDGTDIVPFWPRPDRGGDWEAGCFHSFGAECWCEPTVTVDYEVMGGLMVTHHDRLERH